MNIVDVEDPWQASRAWLDAHRTSAPVPADVDGLTSHRLVAFWELVSSCNEVAWLLEQLDRLADRLDEATWIFEQRRLDAGQSRASMETASSASWRRM
jgi:hypothetical protein